MYHHLRIAEGELSPSGKEGSLMVKRKRKGVPLKKIGFTVSYHGDVEKLIGRIVYNVKKYGLLIPNKFNYIIRPSDLMFKDVHNDTIWSVSIQKTKMIRYLNFQTEIQCLP